MKTGRNDPCPCGSGQKYKKCCEAKDEAARVAQLAAEAAAPPPVADEKDAAAAAEGKSPKSSNARSGDWLVPPRKEASKMKAPRARRRTV